MEVLTRQENKITHLIANGLIEKEIASELFISPTTVHTHTRNIRRKLQAKNIADITRKYILSLPKASDVLKVAMFIAIQFHIMFNINVGEIDLRMARRAKPSRATKTARKWN